VLQFVGELALDEHTLDSHLDELLDLCVSASRESKRILVFEQLVNAVRERIGFQKTHGQFISGAERVRTPAGGPPRTDRWSLVGQALLRSEPPVVPLDGWHVLR
jgi:hypothetical protein